jgi:predicted nucleic acid-binding protein
VARRSDRSFHDGLYVALAAPSDCPVVTADRKLYNSLRREDLAERMVWVEELDAVSEKENT